MNRWMPVLFLSFALWGCAEGDRDRGDEAAIRQKTQSYAEAYNRKDADAIAQFWLEDAEYTNLMTGYTVEGREAIREEFEDIFSEGEDVNLEMSTGLVAFPKMGEAVETGIYTVSIPDQPSKKFRYRLFYTYSDGDWYLSREGELEELEFASNYENLKELEWLIGKWEDADDEVYVESEYRWDENKNFIRHTFKVDVIGKKEIEGERIIGWDPVNGTIRSWQFDSRGGFAEAEWYKEGDRWVIESANTLPDGRLASQIQVVTPEEQDSFIYEIPSRVVDGEIQRGLDSVQVIRKRG
jgi:uncharacterized protein (TIGR02246 family)